MASGRQNDHSRGEKLADLGAFSELDREYEKKREDVQIEEQLERKQQTNKVLTVGAKAIATKKRKKKTEKAGPSRKA